jgi:hypothetical protein
MSLFSELAAIKAAMASRGYGKTTGYLQLVMDDEVSTRHFNVRYVLGMNSPFSAYHEVYRVGCAIHEGFLPPKQRSRTRREYRNMLIKMIRRSAMSHDGMHGTLFVRAQLSADRVYIERDLTANSVRPSKICIDCGDPGLYVRLKQDDSYPVFTVDQLNNWLTDTARYNDSTRYSGHFGLCSR